MITSILSSCGVLGRRARRYLKQWTKPVAATLVTGALSDIGRSRADLIAENALLRQQLIVLKRQVRRPQLTNGDRIRLVLLARCTQFWKRALFIVQPETCAGYLARPPWSHVVQTTGIWYHALQPTSLWSQSPHDDKHPQSYPHQGIGQRVSAQYPRA